MKTTVDTDLTIEASEEAKICLNCEKKKCNSAKCKRIKQKIKELRQNKLTLEQAKALLEEEYERAQRLDYVINPLAYALYQVWKKADKERGKNGT